MSRPGADERAWRHEVGERLRYLRGAARWTQAKLARVAGVGNDTVSAYELGRVPVDLADLARPPTRCRCRSTGSSATTDPAAPSSFGRPF